MKCQDFEREYLQADGHFSSQVLDHARDCRSCRELLHIFSSINNVNQAPSPELDRQTLSGALACMHTLPVSTWPRRIQTFLYATAAALVLTLAVISLEMRNPIDAQDPTLASKTSISELPPQLAAENSSDLDALWFLSREEANSELNNLELQLSLYANTF